MSSEMSMNTKVVFDRRSGMYEGVIAGKKIRTPRAAYVENKFRILTGKKMTIEQIVGGSSATVEPKQSSSDKFDINTRFGFVEKLVKMVASGVQPSAVITGEGGLGKSFTVMKTLEESGYRDTTELAEFQVGMILSSNRSYVTVKGYSTAKGLYRTLFENRNNVIVFDDCDSVLKDPVALNLLKGALDSYGKRVISWNADIRDEDLPRSFNFEGRVIFISNLTQDKIDQAIRSRSMMIDLTMTLDQKIDRMEFIAKSDEFLPEYSQGIKSDAIALIRKLKDEATEISLRTLISVAKIRASNDDWKDLATYMLVA